MGGSLPPCLPPSLGRNSHATCKVHACMHALMQTQMAQGAVGGAARTTMAGPLGHSPTLPGRACQQRPTHTAVHCATCLGPRAPELTDWRRVYSGTHEVSCRSICIGTDANATSRHVVSPPSACTMTPHRKSTQRKHSPPPTLQLFLPPRLTAQLSCCTAPSSASCRPAHPAPRPAAQKRPPPPRLPP